MKKIILRIISCIVFVALLVGAIHWCSSLLVQKKAIEKYEPFFESDTNFDVLYFGTSHMWNFVLPMEMWREYGISSYNWGYSNCTPAEEYYIVQDVLKYTDPKVIVIDAYGLVEYNSNQNGKFKDTKIEQQHVQFDSFPIWSVSKYQASKDIFDTYEHSEDIVWNFIMYHNRWSELGREDFELNINTEKGAYFFTGLGDDTYNRIPDDEKIEINSVCYPYYLDMIDYCQKQGIEVLCVYLPFGAKEQQQRVANTLGEVVEQYPNCRYVNMLNEGIIDLATDISKDDHHLNYSGALKVTSWLGGYLRDNYELDDYSGSESWAGDYQKYYEYKEEVIKEQTTLASCLVQLADGDFTGEVEIYDEALKGSSRLAALLENAGIQPVYTESDTGSSVKLTVYSAKTGEKVTESYFTSSGTDVKKIVLKTGWQKVNEQWYYYGEDGIMVTGFREIDGETYYFEDNGRMFTGWRRLDGKWYLFEPYMEPQGAMVTGWRQIGGKWYYLQEDGVMVTGFQDIDGERYYFNEDGKRETGWIEYGGERYWLDENGIMARDTVKRIDGTKYRFDKDGVCDR